MTTSNNFTAGEDYPFMKMPKQKLTTSDFDEKYSDLEACVMKVYDFFMWFGSRTKSNRDELRSIIFLECLFLQMFVTIRDLFQIRDRGLNNEHTDKFKDILMTLNDQMHRGTKYIRRSNDTLERELNNDVSCAAAMRQDVVDGFREQAVWLSELTKNPQNRKRAKQLQDELGLNYKMKMYGCFGDDFEQHTNMVLNGLMLLACPSKMDAHPDEYREMFDNSLSDFQSRKTWKPSFDAWKRKILKAYDLHDIVEDKDKMVYLKKFWAALDKREQELLEKFGIEHDNARHDSERATMGQRIHEHLNNDDDELAPRMQTEDLQQYLLYVIQKKYIDEEIDKLRPDPSGKKEVKPPGKKSKRQLFKQKVNIPLLINCLNEVYCRFFVDEDKEALKGNYTDLMALMAYLFIICESEDYFENGDMVPFYKFCTNDCQFVTTKSDRTFRNRLEKLEGVKPTDEDYQKVLRIFHGTKKYEALRRLKDG